MPELLGGPQCTLLSAKLASECIAKKAYRLSLMKGYMSPFARESIRAGDKQMGGKEDDISVILAQVIAV